MGWVRCRSRSRSSPTSDEPQPSRRSVQPRRAAGDDVHIAVYHADGRTTGTSTWIWSVVADSRIFVRAFNGTDGKWYRSALKQRFGTITAAGQEREVEFAPVDEAELAVRIDSAYEAKYAGSPYLPPMVAAGPKAATVEVAPRR